MKKTAKKAAKKKVPKKAEPKVDALAREIEEASPLEDGLRKRQAARTLAWLLLTRDRWFELELSGQLDKEKSRQLGRLSAEVRKYFDELEVVSEKPKKPGFMGLRSK